MVLHFYVNVMLKNKGPDLIFQFPHRNGAIKKPLTGCEAAGFIFCLNG